jgi:hypothetical protein
MQSLATYLLEKTVLSNEEKISELNNVRQHINKWLLEKGVKNLANPTGEFKSLTSSEVGHYKRETATNDDETWEQIKLEESPRNNQLFTTTVSLTTSKGKIFVHITLSATTKNNIISPISIDARCPSIVRDILRDSENWSIGDYLVPQGISKLCRGDEQGLELAHYLKSGQRIFPIVVVSEYEGEQIWDGLSRKIAHDLAGLAQVYEIDDKAAWALTDVLQKINSCYSGAIRLYWPNNSPGLAERVGGRVWTPYRLLSEDKDGDGESRFRFQLRQRVMSVSALTVLPPRETKEIQSASAHKRLKDLEGKAASSEELYDLAQLYLSDVDQLRAENSDLKDSLSLAVTRAENAEAIVSGFHDKYKGSESEEDSALEQGSVDDVATPPEPGEIRFYKKIRNTPSHDLLMLVADCQHTSWQPAHKAEKAKKGIEKLEGINTWDAIHHCGSCKGGGLWRVKWQ